NKQVSNRPPAEYLPEVLSHYPDALAAQSVPEQQELWNLDRFEDFLAERRQRLAHAMSEFLESLLDGGAPVEFTIADYVAVGENEAVEFKSSLRWDFKQGGVNKVLEKIVARTV